MPSRKSPPSEPNGGHDRAKVIWTSVGACVFVTVVLTALYGPEVKSARAFQVLALWKSIPQF